MADDGWLNQISAAKTRVIPLNCWTTEPLDGWKDSVRPTIRYTPSQYVDNLDKPLINQPSKGILRYLGGKKHLAII
jgi:hypothetical protein